MAPRLGLVHDCKPVRDAEVQVPMREKILGMQILAYDKIWLLCQRSSLSS